ncbi:MAG: phosphoribosylformylglycinamidine synthase subunit PurS [Candidatus Muiribacteriaceae bacterium]
MISVRVYVTHKKGIIDPEGKAIRLGLENLGYRDVDKVTSGKVIDIEFSHDDKARAEREVEDMCRRLLANPNMENYQFEIQ